MNYLQKLVDLLIPWPLDDLLPPHWRESNVIAYPFTQIITDVFIYFIVLFFLVFLAVFVVRIVQRGRLISGLTIEIGEYGRPAVPEILSDIRTSFSRNSELAEAWREFEDSLVTRDRGDDRRIVYKTEEAALVFSEERLLGQHLNLRYWNSVPSILVGMGILGTFVGMVCGLLPFSGVDFTQTNAMQDAIKQLLAGVATAFVTSVLGMSTSLFFNVVEKERIGKVSKEIVDLQRVLDQTFTLTTQEEISFRQEDELAQQTAALKSFSTDLANEIKSAMAQGRQEIITELQKAPDAFSNAMAERLAPSLNDLNDAVNELREQKEESSTEAIGKLIEVFQDSISGNTVRQMETLATTVDDVSQSLKDLPSQMTDMMASVQDKIDQTFLSLAATSEEQMGQSKSMLEGMLSTFQNAIEEITTGTTKASAESANRMRQLVDNSADRLGESVQDMEQSVSELLQRQHGQIEAVNTQINNSKDTVVKGQEMLQQMNESVTSVRQLIETTRVFSRQLNAGSERLEGAGKELTKASNVFKEENEKYLTANRETAKQIQDSLVQSKQLLNDFARRFQIIDSGLKDIFGEIENGLKTYANNTRESINQYLVTFSSQLTKAASALSGSVQALDDILQELTENERETKAE